MRRGLLFVLAIIAFVSCDSSRLFEENKDLDNNQWLQQDTIAFTFTIRDIGKEYNLLCNIRNTSDYPYSRLFLNYALRDSTGTPLSGELKSLYLFDSKTGKPFGNSGIGDVFDNRLMLLENYRFKYNGRYTVSFDQQMRLDTLGGISAIGFRLEEVIKETK